MDDGLIFGRLFLIMPELKLDARIIEKAIAEGFISAEEYEDYLSALRLTKKADRLAKSLKGKTLVQRLLVLAPELFSAQTVDLLRRFGLITVQEGHTLRLLLRSTGALRAASVSEETILRRMAQMASPVASQEFVNLLRSIDNAQIDAIRQRFLIDGQRSRLNSVEAARINEMIARSIASADKIRGALNAGRKLSETYTEVTNARSAWTAVTLGLTGIFSDDLLKAAIKAGLISPSMFDTISYLEKAGMNIWRKGMKAAFDIDGFWGRAMMISEGIISPETIAAMRQLGILDKDQAWILNQAARGVRAITRGQLGKYQASRKFRVTPGETPLQTYARVTRDTDQYLLRLLQESAKRSSAAAQAAMETPGFGKQTRASQQRLVAREMQREMRTLSEAMGQMVLFGEKEVASAAVEAMEWLQRGVLQRLSAEDARALRLTARAGMDSYVSRQENKLRLSRLVYGNFNVWTGRVEREIQIGLLRGLSAKEMAATIQKLIDPKVRGGVSYAAMRLARTEINNAFHNTSIRYSREQPWVRGYKWNLSGSHPSPDICNKMAEEDHDDLGAGVYKKSNVPQKPHPHCFCYITIVEDSPAEFEKRMRRGSYDRYLNKNKGVFEDEYSDTAQSNGGQLWNAIWKGYVPQATEGALDVAKTIALVPFSDLLSETESAITKSDPVRYAQWLARRRERSRLRPK